VSTDKSDVLSVAATNPVRALARRACHSVAREPISPVGSIRPNGGRLLRSPIMETNAGLPAHGERPSCGRAAEQRDELAPSLFTVLSDDISAPVRDQPCFLHGLGLDRNSISSHAEHVLAQKH
jgi:hypothetical protein